MRDDGGDAADGVSWWSLIPSALTGPWTPEPFDAATERRFMYRAIADGGADRGEGPWARRIGRLADGPDAELPQACSTGSEPWEP